MLHFATLSMGAGDPVRCCRCHPESTRVEYRELPELLGELAEIVASWSEGAGPNVELAGPEPLAHPDASAVIAGAGRTGVARLRLHTDAAVLAEAGAADTAVAAGLRHVIFTLLGGTPGVHDVLAGEPGALDRTVGGIVSLRAAASAREVAACVGALVPVCRHNVSDLPSAVAAGGEAGADTLRLRIEDGGLDLAAALPWILAACDTAVVNGVWAEVEGVPPCLMVDHMLHCADVVRPRAGTKSAACEACSLDRLCGGGPADASAETLALLRPPAGDAALGERVAFAREGVGS